MFRGSLKSAFSMEWKTPEASRSKEHSNRHSSFCAPNGPAEHQQLAKANELKVTCETTPKNIPEPPKEKTSLPMTGTDPAQIPAGS